MKKTAMALAAASLLLSSTPALAATSYPECEKESNFTKKSACIRLYQRSDALKEGSNVYDNVRNTVDLLRQVRLNRRSDRGDGSYRLSTRTSNADTLAQRRTEAMTERQQRLQARRTRKQAQAEERQKVLQSRVRTQLQDSVRSGILNKDSLRQRADSLDNTAQKRRQVLKSAQEKCAASRGTADYQSCLSTERDKLLK